MGIRRDKETTRKTNRNRKHVDSSFVPVVFSHSSQLFHFYSQGTWWAHWPIAESHMPTKAVHLWLEIWICAFTAKLNNVFENEIDWFDKINWNFYYVSGNAPVSIAKSISVSKLIWECIKCHDKNTFEAQKCSLKSFEIICNIFGANWKRPTNLHIENSFFRLISMATIRRIQ